MKANELMIGDWAKFNSGYGKVIGITDAGVHFVDRFGGGIASGADHIPLTPEILEKNAEQRTISGWYVIAKGVMIRPVEGAYRVIINLIELPLGIFYVHQLQHVLRLWSIKKEIGV